MLGGGLPHRVFLEESKGLAGLVGKSELGFGGGHFLSPSQSGCSPSNGLTMVRQAHKFQVSLTWGSEVR